ncbi:hypothetical protein L9F63_015272, partial [Diploptera punctata]
LEYHTTQSPVLVQRAFRRRFQHQAPTHKSILKWYPHLFICSDTIRIVSGVSKLSVEL